MADPQPDFVEVYATATGVKQFVPPHYLDNPALMKGLSETPRQRQQTRGTTPAKPSKGDATHTPASGDQDKE